LISSADGMVVWGIWVRCSVREGDRSIDQWIDRIEKREQKRVRVREPLLSVHP
jgi:hypothetical protein